MTDAINSSLNIDDTTLTAIDVRDLLPQQPPFVMVGKLTHFDMANTRTQLPIAADNIFVDNGALTGTGMMENIAQTCAARIGFVNKFILKKGIQIGVIGAIRNFEVIRRPMVGEVITTSITVVEEVFGMMLAEAVITVGAEAIASAQIKIALKEETVE